MNKLSMFFSLSNCLVNIFLIIGVLSLSGMNIENKKSLLAEKRQEKIKKIEAEYDKRKALLNEFQDNNLPKILKAIELLDEKRIVSLAEGNTGIGYKGANLKILQGLCLQISNEIAQIIKYQLQVPAFLPVTSAEIKELFNGFGLDLDQDWKKVLGNNKNVSSLKEQAQEEIFVKASEEIATKIHEIAKQADSSANFQKSDLWKNINNFLVEQQKKVLVRFMVRSTAGEDRPDLANAGGNKSIANVTPDAKNIFYALCEVVASYFESKSIKQRIAASDEAICNPDRLLTPVLIQAMIGEYMGTVTNQRTNESWVVANITSCGVMFTEEIEGGIAKNQFDEKGNKNHKSQLQTSEITLIQASYGHNEGVVNGKVAVDSYYVSENFNIYPVVREKAFRLVADKEHTGKLTQRQNPLIMVEQPALTEPEIIVLKIFAKCLEKFYNRPMDVEFVIDRHEKIIYIVQARPITYKKSNIEPSYLTSEFINKQKQNNILSGEIIGAAGGSICLCYEKNIICADTLASALDQYLALKEEYRKKIFIIITKKHAPSTSHEATTFRGELKPVLFVNDEKIDHWLESKGNENDQLQELQQHQEKQFIIDAQRGLIILNNANDLKEEQLFSENSAKRGFFSYPIPALLSVFDVSIDQAEKQKIIKEINIYKDKFEGWGNQGKTTNLILQRSIDTLKTAVVEGMGSGNKEEAKKKARWASLCVWYITEHLLKKQQGFFVKMLLDNIQRTIIKILVTIEKTTNLKIQTQNTLFLIKILEGLLFQHPSESIVRGYSVADVLKSFKHDKLIEKEIAIKILPGDLYTKLEDQKQKELYAQLILFKELCFNEENKAKWVNFLQMLFSVNYSDHEEQRRKDRKIITDIVAQYGHIELLPMWINMTVKKLPEDPRQYKDFVQLIKKDYKDGFDNIKKMFEVKAQINAFDIKRFANPITFDSVLDDFVATFVDDEKNSQKRAVFGKTFIEEFKNFSTMTKVYIINIMGQFVNDCFDLAIKEVRASRNFLNEKHIQSFSKILYHYLALLDNWITLIDENKKEQWYQLRLTLEECYNNSIEDLKNKDQLNSSPDFAVNACLFFNYNESATKHPQTLSDFFTTVHQNLLSVLSIALNKLLDISMLPRSLQDIHELVSKVDMTTSHTFGKKIDLISVEFCKKSIVLHYNIPMFWHSMGLSFTKKFNQNKIDVEWRSVYMEASIIDLEVLLNKFCWAFGLRAIKTEWCGSCVFKFIHEIPNSRLMAILPIIIGKDFLKQVFLIVDNQPHERWTVVMKELIKKNKNEAKDHFVDVSKFVDNSKNEQLSIYNIEKGQLSTFFENLLKAIEYCSLDFENKIDLTELLNQIKISDLPQYAAKYPEVVQIFESLIEDQDYKDYLIALTAANNGINNPRSYAQRDAINLFRTLIIKKYGYSDALVGAQKGVISSEIFVKQASIRLFKDLLAAYLVLVFNGQEYENALICAKAAVKGDNFYVRSAAINLFCALIDKQQGFSEAIVVAKKIILSTDMHDKENAINLFKALFNQKQAYKDALLCLQDAMKNGDNSFVIDLFTELFSQGKGYSQALNHIEQLAKSEKTYDNDIASFLLEELLKSFDDVEQVTQRVVGYAKTMMKTKSRMIQAGGLELFEILVKKGAAYGDALIAARCAIAENNDSLRSKAISLFQALVSQGQAYTEAIECAEKMIPSNDESIQVDAIYLYKAVLQKYINLIEKMPENECNATNFEYYLEISKRADAFYKKQFLPNKTHFWDGWFNKSVKDEKPLTDIAKELEKAIKNLQEIAGHALFIDSLRYASPL